MNDYLAAGRLEDHPFSTLAGLIFHEGRTGELTLESEHRRRRVYFLGGNPVAVTSDDPHEHLAQILLEHNKISAADAERLSEIPENKDDLTGADFLPKDTLNWGVKFRFVHLCYDLFRWEQGDYRFREMSPPRELFLLKVPAPTLIFKGVGYMTRATLVDALPDEAVIAAGPVAKAEAKYLGPDERKLLDECRPGRTVGEILRSGDDADQARQLIFSFFSLGLVALGVGAAQTVDEPGFVLDEPSAGEELEEPAEAAPALEPEGGPAFSFPEPTPPTETEFSFPPPGIEYPFDKDAASAAPPEVTPAEDYPFGKDEPPLTEEGFGFGPGAVEIPPAAPTEKKTRSGKEKEAPRRLGLPALTGKWKIAIGGGAFFLVAAAACFWWWTRTEEAPPLKSLPPAKKTAALPPSPQPPPPAQGFPGAPPVAPAPPVPQTPAPAPSIAPAAPALMPPVAAKPAVPTGPSAPQAGTDRYRGGLEIFQAGDLAGAAAVWERLLAEEHAQEFTILVEAACEPGTVREAYNRLSPQGMVYLVGKEVKGRNCFRICLGSFPSHAAAAQAMTGLPPEFRGIGATVRPVPEVLKK